MNVSQIGQKKKKQAVRRLSQGSSGQGNRKEDIRRKLEAKRRFGSFRPDKHERKSSKGMQGVKSRLGHPEEAASKRHASPLASTAFTQGSVTTGQNPMTSNEEFKKPLQERQNVFGARGSPNKNQESKLFDTKTSTSPDKGSVSAVSTESSAAKSHLSPLASLVNSPSKDGGSIVSGPPSQANTATGNVALLVEKYEVQQKTTQPSFQTSSSNVFQSAISSSNQLLGSQNLGMFSMKKDTSSNSGSVFGGSLSSSTTAPPNVNLFAMNQKANTNTIVSSSATQLSTSNTLFYGYMANKDNKVTNEENKTGVFGNAVQSVNTTFNTSVDGSANPLGSTNPLRSTNLNPLGSTNLNPIGTTNPVSTQKSIFGGAGFPISVTSQSQTVFTANQGSKLSSLSSPSIFGEGGSQSSSTNMATKPFSSNSSKTFGTDPSTGNVGVSMSSNSVQKNIGPFSSSVFTSSDQASAKPESAGFGQASTTGGTFTSQSSAMSSSPLKSGRIFGVTNSPSAPFGMAGVFTSSQGTKDPDSKSPSQTDNQGSAKPSGIFGTGTSLSDITGHSKPSGLFSASQGQTQGPFSGASKTTTTEGLAQSQKSGSIFGNTGLSTTLTEQQKMPGIFSKSQDQKQGPFSKKPSNPGLSQPASSASAIFGNAGSMTSTDTQKTSGIFSKSQDQKQGPFSNRSSNPGLSQPSFSGSIFAQTSQSSTMSSGRVFSKPGNATFSGVFSQSQNNRSAGISPNEKQKGLKHSLSNTDVSELTSILIKDLSHKYLDKKLLEREFKIFGPNKVTLQPTKRSAIVNFETHESAKKAKSKALELFPFRGAHVFWCKKIGSGRTSKTPEKPAGSQTGFRSRRKSISNALNSIDAREFPPAMSAQERFSVLDEVDKRIRQAITPYTDIANAPVIIGVCCDMCPEKERYMRESQANLSIFEMVPGTQDNRDGEVPKVEHIKAVKEYSRSAADKLEPLAHELRPVNVLQMTLDYLMSNIMDNSNESWDEWFNFLWNRTRAIRKDITQQHLCDVQSADLVEKITRFHIFCGHYLCEEDIHSFDPKINNENLTKCLQTLKQFYVDLYTDQGVKCPNEAEFQAYDILLNLNEGDTLRKAMQYRLEIRNSPEVKFALEVFSSLNSNNFVRFFKLVKSASYLNACILHRYFTQVRRNALRVMTKAYSPNEAYPLSVIQDLFAFEDKDEASRFCSHYNITTSDESVQFTKMSFADPESAFSPQRATNVIESKRTCSIGEVVNGSSLASCSLHQPVSSFDASGRYIGLPNLVQMLQNTPDTPEPESPYDIYESAGNVSSEQRSPVVQQPYPDPRIIFDEAVESTCVDLINETVSGLIKDISERSVCQVSLEQQLTKDFADKFVDDSVLTMAKEIAGECIQNELEIKRRKIAVAESRARMSVVVVNEILNEVLKTELVSLARDSKRVVHQQLKAQSFAKMSAVVMREMLEDVLLEQCNEVALNARKEIVRKKKDMLEKKSEILRRNRMKRYFQKWSKEYHTVIYIRTVLEQIPAKPPVLTPKQQLDRLRSTKDSTREILTSPTSSFSSLIKEREELQKLLKHRTTEHEMKRLRAMQPINFGKLYSEFTASKLASKKTADINNFMKLLVSFSNEMRNCSLSNIEKLIKSKLRTKQRDLSCNVPVELQEKLEQLSENQQMSTSTTEFMYDIKTCYGILSTDELRNVQQHHLLLGLTGVLFVLDTSGDEAGDKKFWSSTRMRLRQILKSKPCIPRIPLVILNINTGNSDGIDDIEEQLGVNELYDENLTSDSVVYLLQKPMDTDEIHKQLSHALLWLMSHNPEIPSLRKDSLVGLVEKEILKHFTIPVYEEVSFRKEALLPPQCPEVIIDLYNTVIDHIVAMVTDIKLQDISLPIPEFITADSPSVSWNSTRTFNRLYSVLRKMRLALPPAPASDGTWSSEYILCLDYVNALLDKEPLKKFGYALINRIERIFSPYAKDSSDISSTTLTAADIPWPEVIEACVKTLLSWLHSLSDLDSVYYLSDNLDTFKEPPLWAEAITKTVMSVKGDPEKRKKRKSSRLHDLTAEVEDQLTTIETSRSRLDVSQRTLNVEDDMHEIAQRFERRLGKEKRNWKRFEEELKSIVDEDDSEDFSYSVQGQGVKRKNPSWSSTFRSEKVNVKENSMTRLKDFPDLNSTVSFFETNLVSLRDGIEMHRHLERLTEKRLKEALEDSL